MLLWWSVTVSQMLATLNGIAETLRVQSSSLRGRSFSAEPLPSTPPWLILLDLIKQLKKERRRGRDTETKSLLGDKQRKFLLMGKETRMSWQRTEATRRVCVHVYIYICDVGIYACRCLVSGEGEGRSEKQWAFAFSDGNHWLCFCCSSFLHANRRYYFFRSYTICYFPIDSSR